MIQGYLTRSSMSNCILILYSAVSVTHPRLASRGNVSRENFPPSSKPVKICTPRSKVWCLGTFQWNALPALQKTMNRLLYCFSGISTPILKPLYLYTSWAKLFGMVSKALLKFKTCHTYHFLSTWQIQFFYRGDTIYTWQTHRIYFYLLIMLLRVIN